MSKIYYPRAERPATAAACLAEHNTAAMALLDALREQLAPCGPEANWADVGAAEDLVRELAACYAARLPQELADRNTLELPTDDGNTLVMRNPN